MIIVHLEDLDAVEARGVRVALCDNECDVNTADSVDVTTNLLDEVDCRNCLELARYLRERAADE